MSLAQKRRETDSSGRSRKRSRMSDGDLSQQPDFETSQTMVARREAGIIDEVSVTNFMSHTRLNFKFGQHVNFIVGLNGSGKSSVLTAIMVGLGGKAALTSRGNSLKSLVKNGKHVAEVTVRLRNAGPDAFRHDVYGDSICIFRRLTDQGQSGYKVAGSTGKQMMLKREELDMILDHFNIQVDNPVVILNQEASKEFLLQKTPSDMYRFFLRATQLEQMMSEYQSAEEAKSITTAELMSKSELLPAMEKEVKNWEQKYNACASLEKLKEKIAKLKDEMAWAFVCEKERLLEGLAKELRAEEARRPKYVQKLEESEKKLKAKEEEKTRIQEELKVAGDEATVLEPQHGEKKNVVVKQKQVVKSAAENLRRVQSELRGLVADQGHIVRRIEEIRGTTQVDYTAVRQAREQKIKELEEQVASYVTQCKTLSFSADKFKGAASVAKEKVDELKAAEIQMRRKFNDSDRKIKELESARGNTLRRFGAWMPDLIKKIDDAYKKGRFKEKPRGPIGANIKLRDGRWVLAVEKCLGNLLTGFCVNDYEDEREFLRIARPVCGQNVPATITSRFRNQVHSVPANHQVYPTVLEVLDIDDPVISNCIIDQRRAEYVLLAEDLDQATDFMMYQAPANYQELFTVQGDQLFSKPCFRFYPNNQSSARFLSENVEILIKDCKQHCEKLSSELREVTVQVTAAESDVRRNNQEMQKTVQQLQKLKKRVADINIEIGELKNVEDPAPVDVRTLEEEVQILDEKIKELEAKERDVSSVAVEARQQLQTVENELHDIEDRIRTAAQKLDPYREHLARIENELDRARQELKHYKQKAKEFDTKLGETRKRHEAAEKDMTDTVAKATAVCAEKIRTRRTAQNIEAEITQIQRQIDIEQRNRGDQEQIKKSFFEKKNRFETVTREVYQLSCFLEKLTSMLIDRNQWFIQTRDSLTLQLKLHFLRYVKIRSNFTGYLKISHDKRTLEPCVCTMNGQSSERSTPEAANTRGLSGGERSFATTCFILSLWDIMESPFRCLDEFDVFMDLVNRRLCMELMLKTAETKPGCQFVFLSPLNMSQLSIENLSNVDMKIFEMAPPRGNQTQSSSG